MSCEKKTTGVDSTDSSVNVIGEQANARDYFYQFLDNDNDISATYLHYDELIDFTNPQSMIPNQDILTLSSFSNYLLKVESQEAFDSLSIRRPFDEVSEGIDISNL